MGKVLAAIVCVAVGVPFFLECIARGYISVDGMLLVGGGLVQDIMTRSRPDWNQPNPNQPPTQSPEEPRL